MWKMTIERFVLALALTSAGCQRSAGDETPIATVRHFLEVMDRSAEDEKALQEAYPLLDAAARAALTRRAERATELAGRAYQPWQMLAQGRFRLHFSPASRGGMRERVEGERATVIVTGENPAQHAEVPLVREQGRWRIQLAVPALRNDGARQNDG